MQIRLRELELHQSSASSPSAWLAGWLGESIGAALVECVRACNRLAR